MFLSIFFLIAISLLECKAGLVVVVLECGTVEGVEETIR